MLLTRAAFLLATASTVPLSFAFADDQSLVSPQGHEITFSRASTATYFDSAGTMQTAAINAPRFDHDPAALTVVTDTELVTNGTFDTDTGWTKGAGWTISGGKATVVSAGGFPVIEQSYDFEEGRSYRVTFTVSDYVKGQVGFTPLNGQYETPYASANGDYTIDFVANATDNRIGFQDLLGGGDAGDYSIDNVSVRALDAEPLGLLIEEARTNKLLRSQELDHASWATVVNVTRAANNINGLDGVASAERLTSTSSPAYIAQSYTGTAGAFVSSVYAKAGTCSVLQICDDHAGGGAGYCNFNLATGLVGSSNALTGRMTAVGNGWYRCEVTATGTATANNFFLIMLDSSTSGRAGAVTVGRTIYLWGAQAEAGAFATSYIPTTSATVTRSADVASMTGTNFSDWYNQSEGTFVVEAQTIGAQPNPAVFRVSDGSNDYAQLYFGSTNIVANVVDTGLIQATFSLGAAAVRTFYKVAFALKVNDFAVSLDGAAPSTDASGTMPTVDRIFIGALGSGAAEPINGHIKSLEYYSTRKSNADLQVLSA